MLYHTPSNPNAPHVPIVLPNLVVGVLQRRLRVQRRGGAVSGTGRQVLQGLPGDAGGCVRGGGACKVYACACVRVCVCVCVCVCVRACSWQRR